MPAWFGSRSAEVPQSTATWQPACSASSHHPAKAGDIDVLNEEMQAAGVRIFAGGLHPGRSAKSLRAKSGGKVLITDGPYLETKEHIGGFWVLEAANVDEALAWGRKSVVACRVGRGAPVSLTTGYKLFGFLIVFCGCCIEKVVHHRDNNGHALHQRDVCRLGQYG